MSVPPAHPFIYRNKLLEVRATRAPASWLIQIFEGDRVATNAAYLLDYQIELDAKMQGSDWIVNVEAFMATAQENLEAGISKLI